MSTHSNFCVSCGTGLTDSPKFCPNCGAATGQITPNIFVKEGNEGVWKRFWRKSAKAKIFYSLWVLLNVTNILTLISAASAPVDRFRSVCGWDGVTCGPSSQAQMGQALLNLVIWNSTFWAFRYFHRKRRRS